MATASDDASSAEGASPVLSRARIAYSQCPLCQSPDIPPFGYADCTLHPLYHPALPPQITWCRCAVCAHVFTDGYFTEEAARLVFAKTNATQVVGHDAESQRRISARMVERVASVVKDGEWLDIGFGNASLLFTAGEFGYHPVGVDLRQDNVEALRRMGYEAHCQAIETLDAPGRFSVISMADVLEHMPFPRQGLDAACRLLRPGGALFLSMPNMSSAVWGLLDQTGINPYWGELEHYHNFDRERLYRLLGEHGLTPLIYAVSERYRIGMEVIAVKNPPAI